MPWQLVHNIAGSFSYFPLSSVVLHLGQSMDSYLCELVLAILAMLSLLAVANSGIESKFAS